MHCLIIAAGKGSRLWKKGNVKPIVLILRVPLIERVIRSAIQAGVVGLYVVSGYQGEYVRDFLDGLAKRCGVSITHVINNDWELGNGLSVLKAKEHLDSPFFLLLGDHLFEPSVLHQLARKPERQGEIALAVDSDTSNTIVDPGDVTRVHMENGKVLDIGKGLSTFNGFDSGMFLCTPVIFEGLERCIKLHGDTSLTGGCGV